MLTFPPLPPQTHDIPPKHPQQQYTKFHGVSLTLLRKFAKQILKALAFLAQDDVSEEEGGGGGRREEERWWWMDAHTHTDTHACKDMCVSVCVWARPVRQQ